MSTSSVRIHISSFKLFMPNSNLKSYLRIFLEGVGRKVVNRLGNLHTVLTLFIIAIATADHWNGILLWQAGARVLKRIPLSTFSSLAR